MEGRQITCDPFLRNAMLRQGRGADIIADFARTVMHATSIQNSLRTFPDFATRNLAVLRSGVMDVCNGNRIDDDRQCDHCIARILTCATGIPSNVVKMCESRLTKGFVFEKSDRCWHYFG